jgi:hypothetical protein
MYHIMFILRGAFRVLSLLEVSQALLSALSQVLSKEP